MTNFRRVSKFDLEQAEAHVRRGEEAMAEQRRRIERIEKAGDDAGPARQTLEMMEVMLQELTERRDRVAATIQALTL